MEKCGMVEGLAFGVLASGGFLWCECVNKCSSYGREEYGRGVETF